MSASIDIVYAAHTQGCTFLLDGEGICRRIVLSPNNHRRDAARAASRCVGAQYVASLDPSAAGLLGEKPRVGGSLLFARVDERGRISLVRTGHVTLFERYRSGEEDPFEAEPLPSMSVETSAPPLPAPGSAPRLSRSGSSKVPNDRPSAPAASGAANRTQPMQPLRTAQFLQLRDDEEDEHDDIDVEHDMTANYAADPGRRSWSAPPPAVEPPPLPTIRKPTILPPAVTEDAGASLADLARRAQEAAAARRTPAALPLPSYPPRMRSEMVPRNPRQVVYPLGEKAADKAGGRRRGDR